VDEELLAALLDSDENLLEALRVYDDDLERLAVEREAGGISRRDVRMDRRVCTFGQHTTIADL